MEIHVHIHNGSEDGSPTPKKSSSKKSKKSPSKPKRKGTPMTRKTQLSINRGRKAKGMKPIKWKKKGK